MAINQTLQNLNDWATGDQECLFWTPELAKDLQQIVREWKVMREMTESAASMRFGSVTFTREGGMSFLEAYKALKEQADDNWTDVR